MKRFCVWILCCAPAMAAINGTVVNRTAGAPASGATVEFYKLAESGPELVAQAQSDAQGKFAINQTPDGPGLLRTTFEGVVYNAMLNPGAPTTNIELDVFNASRQPGEARVGKHMLLFEPSGGQMAVKETFLVTNGGKSTWHDAAGGTVKFYLPAGANGNAQISATAPGSVNVSAGLVKTSQPDVFAVDFAIKPGDTRIDIDYSVPYAEGAAYQGKIPTTDENTYLIAPKGVTLTGANLNDLGPEPQTQAQIYGLTGTSYKIQLTGAPEAAPADTSAASDGAPQIEVVPAKFSKDAPLVLALCLAILAIGFAILYRAREGATEETNERGRR